jgi:hypothetical protein
VKSLPAPRAPGNTEAERFDHALLPMLSVPIEKLAKWEAKLRRKQNRKKRSKNNV